MAHADAYFDGSGSAKARASQMEHQGKLSAADKKIDAKADRILKK